MKVAGKLFGATLILVTVLVMASCILPNGGDNPKKPYEPLTTEFATYYLNIAEMDLGGLEGFHLKNISSEPIGIDIQKIFASTTKSEDGAVVIYDFTQGSDADACKGLAYWGFGDGTCDGTKWSSGEVPAVAEGETEVYITGFASSAFVDASYVGIVAKNLSESVKGDELYLVPVIGNPVTEKAFKFKDAFNK